jgi:hypothetical protein
MSSHEQNLSCVIVACLVSGLIWHFPTRWVVNRLWIRYYTLPGSEKQTGGKDIHNKVQLFIKFLGVLERIIYAGSWLLGAPEIIAVVLALKAAPSLKEWSESKIMGRVQFNLWLIGNFISIIGSVLIAELTRLSFDKIFQ